MSEECPQGSPEPAIKPEDVACLKIVRALVPWRDKLAGLAQAHFGSTHGNARLELIDVLIVLLAAYFNPALRSHRLIEILSCQHWVQKQTGVDRVPRSTLSDALARFDPEQLRPLVRALVKQIPALARRDAELEGITRQVLAADGSYFNLIGEALWALQMTPKRDGTPRYRARWNLQIEIDSWAPVEADVSGDSDGSEAAAFIRSLKENVIYLADRNFVHFGFLNAVLAKHSSFVVRLKKSTCFTPAHARELSEKDRQEGVLSDAAGHLGMTSAGNENRRSRTEAPPGQLLRKVVLWDPRNKQEVILLTDLLEVEAFVIGLLYRRRWQVELFLRFIKCDAGFGHVLGQSPRAMTLELYVAMIGTLLLHMATGRRVSKYALFWLASVASGQCTWEQMEAGLARIEREKELERIRRAKKKAAGAAGAIAKNA